MKHIPILNVDSKKLIEISKNNLLSLNLSEMKAIQKYFRSLNREPTVLEIETLAQTWSEHCKHKTLTGGVEFRVQSSEKKWKIKKYSNLLKETIFKATKKLNKKWCISVFKDNAGVIEFDKKNAIAFKVETHNHPSAIEPYGGAGTGVGGVIRDILGVGLGAKPIMNTDVFCFGIPSIKNIPEEILSPERIFHGVVSGVRDYGNRMGIPTASGAVLFDEGYVFNPLVYCGTVGILPKNKAFKKVVPGDLIVSVGGLTGRDGIHGATFSSDSLSLDIPVSVVQIGNPIVEKKVVDTLIQARDKNLYNAITDCGAGGYSSAIGELAVFSGGARVYLERVPLKYEGLEPWEIWISESQERMVLAVPPKKIKTLLKIFSDEDVSATVIGEFTDTALLEVFYNGECHCCLDLSFLHNGVPKVRNKAVWKKPEKIRLNGNGDAQKELKRQLSSLNICSREWIIRQYDFEVQAKTVIKPFVGVKNDGPSDATVLRPFPNSTMGVVVSHGINLYGKYDVESMAASAIDEALRNIVAVGGDLEKTALLDNFSWGELKTQKQLGEIVKAAEVCYELSLKYGVPFISGKDSLNNKYILPSGEVISIPPTLLISAISIVKDVRKCITMDLKKPKNSIYILGITSDEFPPEIHPEVAFSLMRALQKAIEEGVVVSAHDCSDGGLAVACAEMAMAGEFGMRIDLKRVPIKNNLSDFAILFSESNSRFIVEVRKDKDFEKILKKNYFAKIGEVIDEKKFLVVGQNGEKIVDSDIFELKKLWKNALENYLK